MHKQTKKKTSPSISALHQKQVSGSHSSVRAEHAVTENGMPAECGGRKKHELLAPAGSYEIAKAVIAAGADAVYLAGQMFGARAYASNLDQDRLKDIIDYAHLYDCQIHMTVNTLLKNKEIERDLYDYMAPLYAHGLDAVIVQDFGVFTFLHHCFPDLKLHASTQMSVTSAAGAAFLKRQGASRIVTAREISLKEIRAIKERVDIEIETFIHGALCYCYSGQCLMSSMIGGRSGNRGRCAQPCRLPYGVADASGRHYKSRDRFPLSPKDLCAIELLPELCAAGIDSFKIEGRMKQIEYAAGVTRIYRQCLDRLEQNPENWQVLPEEKQALLELGNRSGFTKGYYQQRNGMDMLSSRDSAHHSGKPAAELPKEPPKIPVEMEGKAKIGEPFSMTVSAKGFHAEASGIPVQEAQKKPLTEENLSVRLGKTGRTPFEAETIRLDLDENAFLPVGAINEVRREALEKLQGKICASRRRTNARQPELFFNEGLLRENFSGKGTVLRVQIADPSMLSAVLGDPAADEIMLDYDISAGGDFLRNAANRIHQHGRKAVFCFPYVCRKETQERLLSIKRSMEASEKKAAETSENGSMEASENKATGTYGRKSMETSEKQSMETSGRERAAEGGFDAYLVRSYDSLGFALDVLKIPAEKIQLDCNLYVFSVYAARAFRKLGIGGFTISMELNRKELMHQEKDGELPVYGRQPLMISAQCVYKNYDFCRKQVPQGKGRGRNHEGAKKRLFLEEAPVPQKKGKKNRSGTGSSVNVYPVKPECTDCYNVIYNSRILNLLDRPEAVRKTGFRKIRVSFTDESREEILRVLEACRFMKGGEEENGRKNPFRPEHYGLRYTHGHFNRGVE